MLRSLYDMPFWQATAWVTSANVAMFFVALLSEPWSRRFAARRITPPADPLTKTEVVLAVTCVILNAAAAVTGIWLWREGLVETRPYGDYGPLTVLMDAIILFAAMDLAMYVFHRIAHHPWLYPIAHKTHHLYENPRPLALFVLNPVEVVGFGMLWVVLIALYSSSAEGILIYLSLNLSFGLVGHLGVEPAPQLWLRVPGLRYVATSTFHAEHHTDRDYNFGFYLLVWDRLLGTLSPEYGADFKRTDCSPVATPSS